MIKNERQYHITKARAIRFKFDLDQFNKEQGSIDPILFNAQRDALQSQIEIFNEEIAEYERLQGGAVVPLIDPASLDALRLNVIRARIARHMTQKDLANRLGVKEQEVQRWEIEDYQTISFWRVKEIVGILMT